MKNNISIIGVGNLTQSLLKTLVSNNFQGKIFVYDIDKKKRKFALQNKIFFKSNIYELLKFSNLVLIAVKPGDYKKVCLDLQDSLKPDTVIMSLMAGIKTDLISTNCHNKKLAITRIMTNINGRFKHATTFTFFNKYVKSSQRKKINSFWKNFGSVNNLRSEIEIEKATALVGSGPAYFIEFAQSLIKVFRKFGFSEKISQIYVNELFFGTAYLCKNDSRSLENIKNTIISKGGTTEAALKSLKKNKFQQILERSIVEAFRKAKNISRTA